ncbi:type II secretion system protein [Candidatus Microgenomates bacterium]|nr:type II secretion system protein [Candidatus Microgenomates bacterium]
MKKILPGFTLIELLVVIAIMGVLATVGINTFPGALAKARDSQRIDDGRKIVAALQQFYTDKNRYAGQTGDIGSQCTSWCNSIAGATWIGGLSSYLPGSAVPTDPKNTEPYYYQYISDGQDYCLEIRLEREVPATDRNYHSSGSSGGKNFWKLHFGPSGAKSDLCT